MYYSISPENSGRASTVYLLFRIFFVLKKILNIKIDLEDLKKEK